MKLSIDVKALRFDTKKFLMASLVFNLLLFGVIGGHVYKRWSQHPRHDMRQALSPETRNLAGRTFQNAFREMKPLGNKARKARAQLIKILSADEFDEEAFDKAAAKMLDVAQDMNAHKIEAVKTLAAQLPVDERRIMAERMTKMIGGGHERRVKRPRRVEPVKPDHKPER